ncbi:fatty acid desaturase 1 (delta-5 desaturase) [Angomonas deanei]|nr:fatty acid desaturase 1 (delta-5 desaturase) [Angomonas deanei]|eukprot:EPY43623.1 fatty acid desaturase 1 (delta-5 desaturase) [Angomonas deanei]
MASSTTLQQPHELYIDGVLYDCSKLKHPGGSVYKYFLGSGDATQIFEEFHIKLPSAKKYLASLPSRPAPVDHSVDPAEQKRLAKLSEDFKELRDACIREGLYDANWPHIIYRFADIFLMHFIGLWLLFNVRFLWPVALICLGVAEGRCGWWMHEAGHYSCTGIKAVDLKIQEILYGFGCGMSGAWWRVNHNKHHATPQKEGHDVDLETLPLVAFNKIIAKKGKNHPIIRRWISVQRYLFAPLTCSLVALFWQLYLHPRHIIRTKRYTEAISIAARWVAVAIICYQLDVTFWQGLFGVLFAQAFGAAYIFVSFSLNHTHLPVLPKNEHAHFVEYAAIYTMDVAPTWFVNWFMGYLNYQIEHHLFPCMPQYRFVELAPRVKKMFEDNGLTYDSRPYMSILKVTFDNLGNVGEFIGTV